MWDLVCLSKQDIQYIISSKCFFFVRNKWRKTFVDVMLMCWWENVSARKGSCFQWNSTKGFFILDTIASYCTWVRLPHLSTAPPLSFHISNTVPYPSTLRSSSICLCCCYSLEKQNTTESQQSTSALTSSSYQLKRWRYVNDEFTACFCCPKVARKVIAILSTPLNTNHLKCCPSLYMFYRKHKHSSSQAIMTASIYVYSRELNHIELCVGK